jgi:4-hydroxy-tetrahydrodipicolinate synthase
MVLKELRDRMRGIFIVTMTPFNRDGSVDYAGVRANAQWLVDNIEPGQYFTLTPCGSTGEFYAMSDEERIRVLEVVHEVAGGKVTLMAGAAQAGTARTIEMCQAAQSIGYDGAQVVLPFYHTPSDEGMFVHFRMICEAVDPDFGIQIYNNPAVAGSWVKPHLMVRLSQLPNLISDKENTPDIQAFKRMMELCDPDDIRIVTGLGERMYSFAFVAGSHGFVSGLANFAPQISYALYEAATVGDVQGVRAAMEHVEAFFRFRDRMNAKYGPTTALVGRNAYLPLSTWKRAMDMMGLAGGRVREPITEITDPADLEELRQILVSEELLSV